MSFKIDLWVNKHRYNKFYLLIINHLLRMDLI